MSRWGEQSSEERALLNPAFCGCLLWRAAIGYASIAREQLPLDIAFLVLPMVLHRGTRELLPRTTATSLAVWLYDHPLSQSYIVDRAHMLVPFTKEAMIFGGRYGLLAFHRDALAADPHWKNVLDADLRTATEETLNCHKRAEFVGKWLAKAGNASTVMAIVGVKL